MLLWAASSTLQRPQPLDCENPGGEKQKALTREWNVAKTVVRRKPGQRMEAIVSAVACAASGGPSKASPVAPCDSEPGRACEIDAAGECHR
jgi:hypothetical protein